MSGKFGKFLGATTAIAAAMAGVAAFLRKKEEDGDTVKEEVDDSDKLFNVDTDFDDEERKYVSITINSKKVKDAADNVKGTVSDLADVAKEKITDAVGEENVEKASDALSDLAENTKDFAKTAAEKAKECAANISGTIKDVVSGRDDDADYEYDPENFDGDFNDEDFDDETEDAVTDLDGDEASEDADKDAAEAEDEKNAAAESESEDDDFLEEEVTDEIND